MFNQTFEIISYNYNDYEYKNQNITTGPRTFNCHLRIKDRTLLLVRRANICISIHCFIVEKSAEIIRSFVTFNAPFHHCRKLKKLTPNEEL